MPQAWKWWRACVWWRQLPWPRKLRPSACRAGRVAACCLQEPRCLHRGAGQANPKVQQLNTVLATVNPAAPENRNLSFPPAGQIESLWVDLYGKKPCPASSRDHFPFPHPQKAIIWRGIYGDQYGRCFLKCDSIRLRHLLTLTCIYSGHSH